MKKKKDAFKALKDEKRKAVKVKEKENSVEKEYEPTIMDFIKKVRFENEVKAQENAQENKGDQILSTQEMIDDSRERRSTRLQEFTCDHCEYRSSSKTLLKRHGETYHKPVYPCNQCDYTATTKDDLNNHIH